MDEHTQDQAAGRAVPGRAVPGRAVPGRARGLRQVRRWSNGTAAALIAATVLATGYFARTAATAAGTAGAAGTTGAAGAVTAGTAGAGQQGTTAGARQPCVSVPVVTSGGSGVTRQTIVRSCGTGSGGSGSVQTVITTTRSGEREDN